MKRTKQSHKVIAVFLTLNFLTTIVPVNLLFANNNGPVAPEATSFEAVDSTDMVNLLTGDMSYVMPLLNVPSPEGGYPIALSYHSGIPMETEASWVGLGWTLNPGAINRSVNGYPDDWKKTRVNDLYYDQGGSTDYYSFSIGGILPNGVTIGMSSAWGGYKAWGGTVGYGGQRFNFDSKGNFGMDLSIGIGKSAGIGYSFSSNGNSSLSLNYSPAGINPDTEKSINPFGFGGRIGYSMNTGAISANAYSKKSGLGVGFSSDSALSASLFGNSAFSSGSTISVNDYYIRSKDKGFNLDVGFFWASYRHRKVSYSLFKDNITHTSGIINTFDYKLDNDFPTDQTVRATMDIKEFYADDDNYANYIHSDYYLAIVPTITLPNYDNYSVSAQGIGGSISPRIFDEIKLSGKKFFQQTSDPNAGYSDQQIKVDYYGESSANNLGDYELGNKIHFYFDNTNSSFLRTNKGNFDGPGLIHDFSFPYDTNNILITNISDALMYDTAIDNTYSSTSTADGNLKKVGNRKRDGNFIETFTVNDIIANNTNGWFIESKAVGFNRLNALRNNQNHLDGIGAYRITTTDGKVYHYSQPVYHFESIFKSFNSEDNENSKFFESKRVEPYATHWLLTAITGPDYVDKNSNGQIDDGDLGYWVEFEYGKWSDGFGWKTPKEGFKINDDNSSYFLGVKEVYYLDQIKTRTHTALFVKSIRNDNKSYPIEIFNNRWSGNSNDYIYSGNYSKYFGDQQYKPYTISGEYYLNSNLENYNNVNITAKKFIRTYMDLPENKSLKLDKILILKNEDAIYDKTINNAISHLRKVGHTYHNAGFTALPIGLQLHYNPVDSGNHHPNYHIINIDNYVLDNHDITGLDLESKAVKQIVFDYDYSLSNNLPNSSAGHLTLKRVHTIGKNNTELIPPYSFSYLKASTPYNKDNQDVWGYVEDNPDAWTMNRITTPLGSRIEIEFEPDSFYSEAAYRSNSTFENFLYSASDNQSTQEDVNVLGIDKSEEFLDIYLDPNDVSNLAQLVVIGQNIRLNIGMRVMTYIYEGHPRSDKGVSNHYTIESLDLNNTSIRVSVNELTNLDKHEELVGIECPLNNYDYYPESEEEHCVQKITFSLDSGYFTYSDPNGKTGGGLRVKEIKIIDGATNFRTSYNYNNPVTNTISGITSYEPFDDENKVVPYIEELPGPQVMYSNVSLSNIVDDVTQDLTMYQFKTLEPFVLSDNENILYSLGEDFQVVRSQFINEYINNFNTYPISYQPIIYKHIIHNNTSSIGNLISIKKFNSVNQLLSATYNDYSDVFYNDDDYSYGISQESFKTYKSYEWNKTLPQSGNVIGKKGFNIGSSSKINYPSKMLSSKTILGSLSNSVSYNSFDFLTGQVLETITEDSRGNRFKNEVTPAYTVTAYNPVGGYGMGAKVDNITNKNMLTQTAMSKSYIEDNGIWNVTGVGISTWNNNWTYTDIRGATGSPSLAKEKIWRKHKTYAWNGSLNEDGTYQNFVGVDDNFNWSISLSATQSNPNWKTTSTITKYDYFSMPLEVKDINDNFASTKMDGKREKVISTSNTSYDEQFYSGAEEGVNGWTGGHINIWNFQSNYAHTGAYSEKAAVGSQNFKSVVKPKLHPGQTSKRYKVSVWVYYNNSSQARIFNGTSVVPFNGETITAGNWIQLNHYVDLSTQKGIYVTANSGNVYFDDFRIHPAASSMTSYVYNKWDELSYILGTNNVGTHFIYDAAGRLIETRSEVIDDPANNIEGGFKTASKNYYNYKNQ